MDMVDVTRLFMLGVSRGGMMTYMALAKHALPVRAAAVIAGPSDLEALGRDQSGFLNGDETYDGWAKVWPDYAHHAADLYRDRSPVFWETSCALRCSSCIVGRTALCPSITP
jgi:dipeptidyl aminopeptidase/acylaminoacyl peptidase